MRKTCTDHCSGCGRHFHSLAAFEQHLRRVGEGTNLLGARSYELEHLSGEEAGLESYTDQGWCELWPSEPVHPVTIWTKPMSERDKQYWASKKLAKPKPN